MLRTRACVTLISTFILPLLFAVPAVEGRNNAEDALTGTAADTVRFLTAFRINNTHPAPPAPGREAQGAQPQADVPARGARPGDARGDGIRIDGVFDEPFWQNVPRSTGFVQYQPDFGSSATESTFVRVAYDDHALYVGLEMYDSEPDKIVNRLTRRDRWLESDVVHVMIDSHHDHLTAYCFTVFSSGTQRDVYYYNDLSADESWDAVWESGTQRTDWGWTAELRIPFHCLRFPSTDSDNTDNTAFAAGIDDSSQGLGVLAQGNNDSSSGADTPAAGTGDGALDISHTGADLATLAPDLDSSLPQSPAEQAREWADTGGNTAGNGSNRPGQVGRTWGIYFSRSICRKGELDRWYPIPESAGGFVSRFGHLVGLNNIKPPLRLEVLPYMVSYAETEPKSLGNPDGQDFTSSTGFDVKYGLSSNITLNATINPDFGQVEADQTVLNLSTFETWYPEKRPFFLEGSTIFNTYYTLFYSRRVGRSPSLWPDGVDYYIDRPAATTILGAAKITGRTSGGTTIGILESVTQREEATYRDVDGTQKRVVVEPESNYLVARVRQDIMRNSSIGIMATAVNQKDSDAHYTGGLDWNLRFREGDYRVSGQTVSSKTGPDESGWGGMVMFEKSGGENFRGSLRAEYRDRGLNLNRVGFLDRANFKDLWGWFQFRTNKKWWIVRRTWNNLNVGYSNNLDNVGLVRGGNFNNNIQLSNYWEVGGGSWIDYDRTYTDTETRGGPPGPIPIGQNWWVFVNTDRRKWFAVFGQIGGGDTYDGHYKEYITEFAFQPKSNIEFVAAPRYRTHWAVSRWLKYIEDSEGNRTDEIFGEQKLHRVDLTMRGTVTFTRDLSLQVYAQPFFAAVDYNNFKRLLPPDSFEYVDSSVYDEAVEQPDFNWTSFNSNVILRWEYRPGSALFLVWTQSRDSVRGLGDFDFNREWNYLFDSDATNTFLVKVSYWWNL